LVKIGCPHLRGFPTNYFWKSNERKPSLANEDSETLFLHISKHYNNLTKNNQFGEDMTTLMENNEFMIMNNSHKDVTKNATTMGNGDIKHKHVFNQKKPKL